jgi:hypothetical protein
MSLVITGNDLTVDFLLKSRSPSRRRSASVVRPFVRAELGGLINEYHRLAA